MGRFSDEDRAWICDFIRRRGGMEAAKARAEDEIHQAANLLEALPASDWTEAMMGMCRFDAFQDP